MRFGGMIPSGNFLQFANLNMAIVIVDLFIGNGDVPVRFLYVDQRVFMVGISRSKDRPVCLRMREGGKSSILLGRMIMNRILRYHTSKEIHV